MLETKYKSIKKLIEKEIKELEKRMNQKAIPHRERFEFAIRCYNSLLKKVNELEHKERIADSEQ